MSIFMWWLVQRKLKNLLWWKAPGSGEDSIIFWKLFPKSIHVSSKTVFSAYLTHSRKMIYFLKIKRKELCQHDLTCDVLILYEDYNYFLLLNSVVCHSLANFWNSKNVNYKPAQISIILISIITCVYSTCIKF